MTSLPSTPQVPSQILSAGIGIGANSFPKLFLFTTVAGFVSLIPVLYLAVRIGDAAATVDVQSSARDGTWALIEALCIVFGILIQAILIIRLDSIVKNGTANFLYEFQRSLRAFFAMLLGFVIYFVAVFGGFILILISNWNPIIHIIAAIAGILWLLIPGFILAVSLIFCQFCIVLDHLGPIAALNRSHTLVWGNWWRTFLVMILMLLIIILIAVVLLVPFALMLGVHPGADTGRSLLVQGVLEMVAEAVFSPFILAIMYVQYHDLKVRRALLTGS